jgi:hypothetical protein
MAGRTRPSGANGRGATTRTVDWPPPTGRTHRNGATAPRSATAGTSSAGSPGGGFQGYGYSGAGAGWDGGGRRADVARPGRIVALKRLLRVPSSPQDLRRFRVGTAGPGATATPPYPPVFKSNGATTSHISRAVRRRTTLAPEAGRRPAPAARAISCWSRSAGQSTTLTSAASYRVSSPRTS